MNIMQSGSKLLVVKIGENGVRKEDLLVHNAHSADDARHYMLSRMAYPDYPVSMGIIRQWKTAVYEKMLYKQVKEAKKRSKLKSVNDLLRSGNTFMIE